MTCLNPKFCRRELSAPRVKRNPLCRKCANKIVGQNPERRAAVSAMLKAKWADPEYRARQVELAKARWKDPEYRNNHPVVVNAMTPEQRRLNKKLASCGVPPEERRKVVERLQ